MKILALQPKEYFDALGINLSKYQVSYGPIFLKNLKDLTEKHDAVVSCIDHSKNSRSICLSFISQRKPAYFFMDGNYDWSNQNNNPYLVKRKIKLFTPFCYSAIFITNKPSEAYFRNHCNKIETYLPKRAYSKKMHHQQEVRKLLITTANTPYFDEGEYTRLLRLLRKVIEASRNLGITIEYRIFDKRILSDLCISETENNTSCSFEDALAHSCAIISTPSTVITTAVAHNIPAASLDYRDTPTFECCGWRIHESVDIPKTITSLISREKDRLELQRGLLGTPSTANELNLDAEFTPPPFHSPPSPSNFFNKINTEYIARKICKKNQFFSRIKDRLKKLI